MAVVIASIYYQSDKIGVAVKHQRITLTSWLHFHFGLVEHPEDLKEGLGVLFHWPASKRKLFVKWELIIDPQKPQTKPPEKQD